MRAVLATPTYGLACGWSGSPHWFCQHMALGETIGFSTRLTQNNGPYGLYQNETNSYAGLIHIALMGDPSLRMHPVGPAYNVSANSNGSAVQLSWAASGDSILGYYVYRSTDPGGPFTRLTSSLLTDTSFTDAPVASGTYTYMVRAVKLENTPSGTYFNPSQGAFATATVQSGNTRVPVHVNSISFRSGVVTLNWSGSAGSVYSVVYASDLPNAAWTDFNTNITAQSGSVTWSDPNPGSAPRRFYRVFQIQ
jgi:hypothetical protein